MHNRFNEFQMESKYVDGTLVYEGKIPQNVFDELSLICNNINKPSDMNERLAGAIRNEYNLEEYIPNFRSFFNSIGQSYAQNEKSSIGTKFAPFARNDMWQLDLQSFWVNFQKKYEFNPLHIHDGVLSFVLWVKIPYTRESEMQHSPGARSKMNMSGCFSFVSNHQLGIASTEYYLDPSWEGVLVVFPSNLAHQVYPFYSSDETRISISGNLYAIPSTN